MALNRILMAAVLALCLALAGVPASAQQQSAGTIAGMSPAMAAAAGLGIIIGGVLIADEIGSSGSSDLFPPGDGDDDDDDDDDDTVTTTTTTEEGAVTTTTTTTN